MKATCSVEGCGNKYYGRGLCGSHYGKWRRTGSPAAGPSNKGLTVEQRILNFTAKGEGCWHWKGALSDGYGQIKVNGQMKYAHTVVHELATGPIPDGMRVDHKCRTASCVRPSHLRTVTNKQNLENLSGANRNNRTSGVRGVSWDKSNRKWIAQIGHNCRKFHIGSFETVAEAEAAAIAKRNELFTHNDLDRKVS